MERQYFSHPKGLGDDCELKMQRFLKNNKEIEDEDIDILKREYYNKQFNDVNVEMSDYISEEGYPLTKEQKEIIFSKEDRIKISALAGSSKTTTLYYYAKERPYKKILYIVYNKSMQQEAQNTFGKLDNVEIRTIHSMAYKYVGKYYRNKLTNNYNSIDVIKDLNLDWNKDQEIAVQVNEMLKAYTLSEVETFEELKVFDDAEHKNARPRIIALCERLWEMKKDYNSRIQISHDFYLKLFQLAKKDLSDRYDIILLDEAQDSSKLVLDILMNSKVKGIVCVGDEFQSIYQWRNSQNILQFFKGKEYKLTTSFRISQQTANIANLLIKDSKNIDINMKGFNSKQKIVNEINRNKPYVCLCRTNSNMFQEVIDSLEEYGKKKLYFEGGFSACKFNDVKDTYYFYQGHETRNPLLKKFKDYNQMRDFAERNQELELLSLVSMVEKYRNRIPELIDNIKNHTVKDKDKADVLFSTIHKSKGATYTIPVVIADDHMDIEGFFNKKFIEKDRELNEKKVDEEINILYVAITRAKHEIQLSDSLKNYLVTRYEFFSKQDEVENKKVS